VGCDVALLIDSIQHHGGVLVRGVALISIIESSYPVVAHIYYRLLQGACHRFLGVRRGQDRLGSSSRSSLHSVNFEFTEPLLIRYCPASLKFLPSVSLYRGPPLRLVKLFVLSPVRMTESYAQKGQFFPSPAGSQTPAH